MAVFTYKAIEMGSTSELRGTIAADTPRQARDLLRDRGLSVRDLNELGAIGARRAARGRAWQVTLLIRELSTLLSVGMPLLEALDTTSAQHSGKFRASILLLRERVAGGSSLAAAMREQPHIFDDLACTIAEVGEDAGTLDTSLDRLAEFRERSQQFRGRIGTMLIYPVIVLLVALVSTLFLMTFVVPKILQPLVEQGLELPLPTRIVKTFSDTLVNWWWLIAAAAVAVACAFAALLRTPSGRLAWHRLVLRLPIIGELIRKQAVVRMSVVLGTLLRSGVVFIRALQIAQRTAGNLVLRDALIKLERAVTAGSDIAQALAHTRAFPPMVVQMFALGQQSGRLDDMLDRLAHTYDQQLQTSTQRLAAILEPLLIILLALIVLFIVLATVLPILEAGNVIA
jgi:type II secretory pathway component PulF